MVLSDADALLQHRLIAQADQRIPWRMRTPSGAIREIDTEPGVVVPQPAVAKIMRLGGAGSGWLPDFDARDALAARTLVRVPADRGAYGLDVHALHPSHRSLSTKVRVFIDALAAHMADLKARWRPALWRAGALRTVSARLSAGKGLLRRAGPSVLR